MYNNDFGQNMNMDSSVTGNYNYVNQDMDVDVNVMTNNSAMMGKPMNEGVQERVINRTFVHEVPQPCFVMIEK